MKKKLLITSDCFLPRWDGVARFVHEIIPELAKKFKITIVAPAFEGDLDSFDISDVHIIRIPLLKIKFGDIYFSKFAHSKIKELVKNTDFVFNQTIGPIGICAILLASKQKKPILSYIHSLEWELASKGLKRFNSFADWAARKLNKWLYNKCDILIVPSREVEDLMSLNGVRSKKILLQLGINTSQFQPPLVKSRAKKNIGLNATDIVIGFVGRLGREKDLPTLYRAFRRIRRHHKNVILLIVGACVDCEKKKHPKIIYTGKRNNVIPFLQAMDIFVLPSLTETSSLATMEAMATGIPVIATPVGLIKKYVTDGVSGYIFPRHDDVALFEKLDILIRDRQLRGKLGREARKIIVSKDNPEDVAKQLSKIIINIKKLKRNY